MSRDAGVWIRVSTEEQARGESPAYHEARARSYAELKGWRVVEKYDLSGVSGKSVLSHPEAKRMMADVASRRIKALVFTKLARLGREHKGTLGHIGSLLRGWCCPHLKPFSYQTITPLCLDSRNGFPELLRRPCYKR